MATVESTAGARADNFAAVTMDEKHPGAERIEREIDWPGDEVLAMMGLLVMMGLLIGADLIWTSLSPSPEPMFAAGLLRDASGSVSHTASVLGGPVIDWIDDASKAALKGPDGCRGAEG